MARGSQLKNKFFIFRELPTERVSMQHKHTLNSQSQEWAERKVPSLGNGKLNTN